MLAASFQVVCAVLCVVVLYMSAWRCSSIHPLEWMYYLVAYSCIEYELPVCVVLVCYTQLVVVVLTGGSSG
jgi:hypothetical protein